MTWRLNAWSRFQTSDFWWIHAIALTWFVFTAMLFVIEPSLLERLLAHRAEAAPEATYRRIEWLHRCLLVLSLATIAGAVVGSMGVNLFDL